MAILTIKTVQTGLVGVLPSIAYINTTNTLAEAQAAGFLNKEVANGASFSIPCLAIVATKETPTSAAVVSTFNVQHSGVNWSLTPLTNSIAYAAQATTAGGAAAEAITVTGALATDLAFVQMVDPGTNTVSVVQAVVTANTLTVTFSADPGNDAIVNYQIVRRA